ncbi:sensor histidine kinase [Actinoplanes friuliensis]|uniref:histidine kinase n=1 Tax=Actinoplanes friuliensis DSM 7358 TaxID=1246995 RepID=U5VVV9_9ACTN|nr:histidine kinase [Actinoplanes friuliensis]AGZ41098.1 two-component system histidine kinase [Actinoplanes friuliensis DSM 7358]
MTQLEWSGWLPLGAGSVVLGGAVLFLFLRRRRAPESAVPVRLLGLLLAAAVSALLAVVVRLTTGPGGVPDRLWALSLVVLLPLAVVLYPDDRPPPGLGWTATAVVGLSGGMALLYPGTFAGSGLSEIVAYLLVLAAQWWRYEHTSSTGRRALQWLALGSVPGPLLAAIASFVIPYEPLGVLGLVVWIVFVACFCVGLVAPELRDVRAIMLSVIVHSITVLLVMSVFATVIALADTIAGDPVSLAPGALGLIAAACAIGYAPFARLFRQVIELLLFGARSDPIAAASRIGERLGHDPVPALRSLRESLTLPYAALLDESGEPVAVSGQEPESVVRCSLIAGTDTLGHLVVGLRPGQVSLLRGDEQVVAVLAPALTQLMQARKLRGELQASRAAVVSAIEEERRRLRRDLHDGTGPRLTGIAYAADAARNILGRDPDRAAQLLAGVRAEAGEAIVEVRRLVEGLRPPSLDQVGLEQSVRQHAQHLLHSDGRPMAVEVRVPAELPALTAAVEVTAYRIVVEALTNASRHSHGHQATVTLSADEPALVVEIHDDGPGDDAWDPGDGMTSMRERAEMLGGTLTAGPDTTGGRVIARLPLIPSPQMGDAPHTA